MAGNLRRRRANHPCHQHCVHHRCHQAQLEGCLLHGSRLLRRLLALRFCVLPRLCLQFDIRPLRTAPGRGRSFFRGNFRCRLRGDRARVHLKNTQLPILLSVPSLWCARQPRTHPPRRNQFAGKLQQVCVDGQRRFHRLNRLFHGRGARLLAWVPRARLSRLKLFQFPPGRCDRRLGLARGQVRLPADFERQARRRRARRSRMIHQCLLRHDLLPRAP